MTVFEYLTSGTREAKYEPIIKELKKLSDISNKAERAYTVTGKVFDIFTQDGDWLEKELKELVLRASFDVAEFSKRDLGAALAYLERRDNTLTE